MSLAYDISGNFKLPLYDGGDLSPIPFAASGSYTNEAGGVFTLTGSGTEDVDLGTVTKIKALLILVGTGTGAAPVGIKLNGSVTAFPISPAGMVLLHSPSPVSGITQLSIDYTSNITLQIVALG
jgi:hypothetical protein